MPSPFVGWLVGWFVRSTRVGSYGAEGSYGTRVLTYADERARPVLVLHDDGPLTSQERDPLHLVKRVLILDATRHLRHVVRVKACATARPVVHTVYSYVGGARRRRRPTNRDSRFGEGGRASSSLPRLQENQQRRARAKCAGSFSARVIVRRVK